MTDAPFVVAGWAGTALAVAGYALSIRVQTRRTRRAVATRPTTR